MHDKLSNKMLGLVIGLSLACGLAAGVAGTAITNALSHQGGTGHARMGMPYASDDADETAPYMQEGDGEAGHGFEGRGMGGPRGRMGQAPQDDLRSDDSDQSDRSGESDADGSGSSDSGKSSANASGWHELVFETV